MTCMAAKFFPILMVFSSRLQVFCGHTNTFQCLPSLRQTSEQDESTDNGARGTA